MAETMTCKAALYVLRIVKRICTEVGPGLPGTPQERERAAILKEELESHLGAQNVAVEEFPVAPGAFLGSQKMSALFLLVAALLNNSIDRLPGILPGATALAVAVTAFVFSALPALLFLFQFILAFAVIDPLFNEKQSVNVIGTLRKPGTKTVKRLLILSGHHDSAWENNWLRWLRYGFFFVTATYLAGLIVMLAMSIIQLAGVITGNPAVVRLGTLGWGMLAYPILPSVIFSWFFHRAEKNGGIVPGAMDNLSGSALTVAMCQFLVNNPACIPDDTEIRFISFGSEEAGLRGSRHYVARHLDELKHLDARLLNFEMVVYPEISILTSDKNGTVKNKPEMVKSVVAAAERAGVPYQVKPASIGEATDSAPFSMANLKATTLLPFHFPQQMVDFYHQRRDGPEVLTTEPLFNVLKLALEWIRCGGE